MHCLHEIVALFDQGGHAVQVLITRSRQCPSFDNQPLFRQRNDAFEIADRSAQ
jgi:hypothetical protein